MKLAYLMTLCMMLSQVVVAETAPTSRVASSQPIIMTTLDKLVLGPLSLKEATVEECAAVLRRDARVGVVVIDVKMGDSRVLGELKRSINMDGSVSVRAFLKLMEKQYEGLHWECTGGSIVIFPKQLDELKQNPLRAIVHGVDLEGTIDDFQRKLSAAVPELYPQWQFGEISLLLSDNFSDRLAVNTDEKKSVLDILGFTAAEYGFRWTVVVYDKKMERQISVSDAGKPETTQSFNYNVRTELSVTVGKRPAEVVSDLPKQKTATQPDTQPSTIPSASRSSTQPSSKG